MGFEFSVHRMAHVVEVNANSFAAGEPKRGHQITVSSHHNDDLRQLA